MQSFIIVCLCATVIAAPQGYQYNQQPSSLTIGIPNGNTNSQIPLISKTQESHGVLQQAASTGSLQQALLGQQNYIQNNKQFSTPPYFAQYRPAVQQQENFGFSGVQQQQQVPLINNFGVHQQQQDRQQQFNNFQHQYQNTGTVTKDIYVHVAPEDAPDQQYQQPALPPPPPRKHYRIVFIKAPSQTNHNAALRIQQAPAEEKTIIYVLTKKADPLDFQAALQEVQTKQPSKPEVYFIKYKTKEEAQHAQRTIQAQYDQLGGTSQISDEGVAPVASVIGSLDGSQPQAALDISKNAGRVSSSSSASSSGSSFTSNANLNRGGTYLPPIVKF